MSERAIELTEQQQQRIAKALADPQRFAILACIASHDEIPCKTLVAEFPVTQATISHHLKELVAADLIRSRREGQLAILSCRRDICGAYTTGLAQQLVTPVSLKSESPKSGQPDAGEAKPSEAKVSDAKTSAAKFGAPR